MNAIGNLTVPEEQKVGLVGPVAVGSRQRGWPVGHDRSTGLGVILATSPYEQLSPSAVGDVARTLQLGASL